MNVLARLDDYVHNVRAGSEVTLHQMLLWLVDCGHDVQVVAETPGRGREELAEDGIPLLSNPNAADLYACYEWADVVVTQQAITRRCIEECAGRAPIVFVCHVRGQDNAFLRTGEVALVVFNSQWMALESNHVGPTMVVRPPVHVHRYETGDEDRQGGVLQVNLSEGKGGPLFWWLARHMTHRKFLAGEGTWGTQSVPNPLPPNVTFLPKTADTREHYGRATVVLMPSKRETYGRVALEAACSGIPAIVGTTPGLREAMGPAALYACPMQPGQWVEHLKRLEDPEFYAERSALARDWAEKTEEQSRVELDAWECALLQVASSKRARVWGFASESHYVDHVWPYLTSVDPRSRGPLVVPAVLGGSQHPALARAWTKGAVVFRLPTIRSRSQKQDVDLSLCSPDYPGSVAVVVSERDHKAAEDLFKGRVVRGEHGAGQSYVGLDHHSFPGGPGHAGCLAATAPNEEVASRIRSTHRDLTVAVVGCPRLRALEPRRFAHEDDLLVVSFRRDGADADCQELESAWEHYADLEPPEGWRLALHVHPRARGNKVAAHFSARGWEVIEEFGDVLERASVFACDNSSALAEWYHVRRGRMVLLNCPTYRRWQNHGLRFWEMLNWKGVYPCDGPLELGDCARAAADAGEVAESTWYAAFDEERLERWLCGMLRPDLDVVRAYALQTFEGQYGRVIRGLSSWVPAEYAKAVEAKGLARILDPKPFPELGRRRARFDFWWGATNSRWLEAGLWRT